MPSFFGSGEKNMHGTDEKRNKTNDENIATYQIPDVHGVDSPSSMIYVGCNQIKCDMNFCDNKHLVSQMHI